MTEYLVFRLYGPIVSWGEIAVGEVRESADHPTKSAVLGLLAAALRMRRDDEEAHRKLSDAYGFAVLSRSPGTPLVDYHTTQVPASGSARRRLAPATRREELSSRPRHDLGTVLSRRDYRMDALADVALWVRLPSPPHTLAELRDALDRPGYVLYLGRKSCPPALPLQARLVAAPSIREAFATARFDEPEELREVPRGVPALFWEDGEDPGIDAFEVRLRRDSPASRRRWQFVVRRENQATFRDGD